MSGLGPYSVKLVGILGEVARKGLSGLLALDDAAGDTGASLGFSRGQLVTYKPPGATGNPDDAAGGAANLRQRIDQAAHRAGASGAPAFHPATTSTHQVPPHAPTGLTAADLAIDLSRHIEDKACLRRMIQIDPAARVTQPQPRPMVQPHASLGPTEGFLLSRADGKMTLAQILESAPFGEMDTLRGLAALKAVGMLDAGDAMAQAAVGGSDKPVATVSRRMSDLDRFLERTGSHSTEQLVTHTDAPPAPKRREIVERTSLHEKCTPEQQQERVELLRRCQALVGQDHYAVLGVERTANESAIRHGYYRLARLYHPDRLLRPHLEDLHLKLEEMFAAITEAYNTLSNSAHRAEYDRELAEIAAGRRKEPGRDKHSRARDAYLRGRKEMEAKQVFEAIRMFETAIENDPTKAEYFHYLGICQGQNPRWRKKAEEHLLKAIRLNPSSPSSYLALAQVYMKGGLERRALEMYALALKWDPTNLEAQEAVARGPSRSDDHGTGSAILRSIFKKD